MTIFSIIGCLLSIIGCLLLASSFHGKHRSGAAVADSIPEHTLAGVDIRDSDIAAEVQRLGTADRIIDRTHSAGSDERTYEWDRDGTRLQVESEYDSDASGAKVWTNGSVVVEVWGTQHAAFAHTGKGLFLGDGLGQIRHLYGRRFQKISSTRVVLQWMDGTALAIDFDHNGRIVHMRLAAEN